MAFMGPLAIAASAGSAIFSGIASYNQGQYQGQVARNNAQIMEMNAEYARQKGSAGAASQDLKTRAIVGTQKAKQAASGIDVNTGTAVDVRRSTEELGRMDALTIMNNAEREAFGYKALAANYLAEANLQEQAGTNRMIGSLIGGASSVSDRWMSYRQSGWV